MSKDSFIFYKSFYEAISEIPKENQIETYNAIMVYALGLNDEKLPEMSGISKAIFTLIKPQLDANRTRYENGKKGGRPRKEEVKEGVKKTEQKPKQNLTKTEPKPNVNVNGNGVTPPKPPKGGISPPRVKTTHENIQLADISDWLQTKGFEFDLDQELENFRHYYAATGGKMSNGRAVKDWNATLKQWLNRAQTFKTQSLTKPRGNNAKLTGANANNGSAGISGLSIDEQTEELKRQIRSGQLNPSVV